ncbi:MAG: FKBP-type peptidyl-prolyl cis-trans isomerase [Phycisphaerae bacterium]|nr:FKBP-type peptidyl-prolyl cis-trans isomerase [Phycisphaerae bacterium]
MIRAFLLLTASLLTACHTQAPRSDPPPPAAAAAAPTETTTPDGLVIRDQRLGTGDPCPPHATVTIKFTASLPDGRVYDSSDLRKKPLTFSLAKPGPIRGLREGIPGMRVGGRRHLHIPWPLAYGEQGRDPIPPKTDLDFDIELVAFDPVIN